MRITKKQKQEGKECYIKMWSVCIKCLDLEFPSIIYICIYCIHIYIYIQSRNCGHSGGTGGTHFQTKLLHFPRPQFCVVVSVATRIVFSFFFYYATLSFFCVSIIAFLLPFGRHFHFDWSGFDVIRIAFLKTAVDDMKGALALIM